MDGDIFDLEIKSWGSKISGYWRVDGASMSVSMDGCFYRLRLTTNLLSQGQQKFWKTTDYDYDLL